MTLIVRHEYCNEPCNLNWMQPNGVRNGSAAVGVFRVRNCIRMHARSHLLTTFIYGATLHKREPVGRGVTRTDRVADTLGHLRRTSVRASRSCRARTTHENKRKKYGCTAPRRANHFLFADAAVCAWHARIDDRRRRRLQLTKLSTRKTMTDRSR